MFLKLSRNFVEQSVKHSPKMQATNKLFNFFVAYKTNKTDVNSSHYTHVIKREYKFNSGAN